MLADHLPWLLLPKAYGAVPPRGENLPADVRGSNLQEEPLHHQCNCAETDGNRDRKGIKEAPLKLFE
jgi:hypothetical protein